MLINISDILPSAQRQGIAIAYPMPTTWASHIAHAVLIRDEKMANINKMPVNNMRDNC